MESQTISTENQARKIMSKFNKRKIFEILFKIIQIIFFLDFGFFNSASGKLRKLYKYVTVIASFAFCSIVILTWEINTKKYGDGYFIYIPLILCFLNIVTLACINPNRSIYKVIQDLQMIDRMLLVENKLFDLEFLFIYIIFVHINVSIIMFCMYGVWSFHFLYYEWIYFSAQLVKLTFAFTFYLISRRLERLAILINTAESNHSSLQAKYRSIVDVADRLKTSFDLVFLLGLLDFTLTFICVVYIVVESIFYRDNDLMSMELLLISAWVMQVLIVMFSPAICAQMLVAQVERIKSILHDKLINISDEGATRAIIKFIRYAEVRGCRYRVYRVIPLDADLPGMVLSFCVTYLIVFIQFIQK